APAALLLGGDDEEVGGVPAGLVADGGGVEGVGVAAGEAPPRLDDEALGAEEGQPRPERARPDGDEERLARRGEDGVVVLVAAGAEGAAPEAERGVDGVLGLDEARERRGPGRELVGPARARRPRRHRDDEAAGAAEARHLGAVRRLPQR